MTVTAEQPKRGWTDVDDAERDLDEQRAYLAEHNGIRGLELLTTDEIERAVKVFRRDGFVVIRDVLSPELLASIRAGVHEVAEQIVALDPEGKGNRMAHRYSFGGSSSTRSQLHQPAWQTMLQIPFVHELMTAVFESDDYMLRAASGDFCMPGAHGYQPLHSDMGDYVAGKTKFSSFHDPRGVLTARELPSPYIAMNFLMVDATPLNGPTRQIPGTHDVRTPIPTLAEEPEWMRLSTVCPAPAGSIQLRDVRAWHGGTPNLTDEMRAIPNLEFYAPWFREPIVPGINRADWEQLSDVARKVTRFTVADSSDPIDPHLALNAPY